MIGFDGKRTRWGFWNPEELNCNPGFGSSLVYFQVFGREGQANSMNRKISEFQHWDGNGIHSERAKISFQNRYRDSYSAEITHFHHLVQNKV